MYVMQSHCINQWVLLDVGTSTGKLPLTKIILIAQVLVFKTSFAVEVEGRRTGLVAIS